MKFKTQHFQEEEQFSPFHPKIIKGVIIPGEYNSQMQPVSLFLYSDDENEYLIEDNQVGRELFKLLQRFVKLSGLVTIPDGKTKVIAVNHYEEIERL